MSLRWLSPAPPQQAQIQLRRQNEIILTQRPCSGRDVWFRQPSFLPPWPSLTFPVGSEGNLSSYFLRDLSLGDPVCYKPIMHRAKRLGEFTVMNMEGHFSCRKDEASVHVKEYIHSKISSHPSSRIVITLSSKGNQPFSFVTLFCTFADFPLYLSHQILDVTETKKRKTNKKTQCFMYGLLGVFLSHKKLQH